MKLTDVTKPVKQESVLVSYYSLSPGWHGGIDAGTRKPVVVYRFKDMLQTIALCSLYESPNIYIGVDQLSSKHIENPVPVSIENIEFQKLVNKSSYLL